MTETTATTGASTGPVETEPAEDSVPTEATPASGDEATQVPEVAASGASEPEPPTTRAESPAEPAPAPPAEPTSPTAPAPPRPSFTRAPGMAPPPETVEGAERSRQPDPTTTPPAAMGVPSSPILSGPPRPDPTASGSFPVVSASAPVSAPPRATGRATPGRASPEGVTTRPIDAAPGTTAAPDTTTGPDPTTGTGTGTAGGPGTVVGAASVTESVRTSRGSTTPRGPRRARLGVKRVDPWSVMKFSFAVSLVLFIVVVVAASVLYLALDSMGVFTSINETVADLVESGGGEGETFRITARGVIGTAGVLGALNVLLFTSLATLGAFIYNVCADLVGGIEVTLAERD